MSVVWKQYTNATSHQWKVCSCIILPTLADARRDFRITIDDDQWPFPVDDDRAQAFPISDSDIISADALVS